MLSQSTPKFRNKNIADEGGASRLTFHRAKSTFAYTSFFCVLMCVRDPVGTAEAELVVSYRKCRLAPLSGPRTGIDPRMLALPAANLSSWIPECPRRISRRSLSIRDNTNHGVASDEWD